MRKLKMFLCMFLVLAIAGGIAYYFISSQYEEGKAKSRAVGITLPVKDFLKVYENIDTSDPNYMKHMYFLTRWGNYDCTYWLEPGTDEIVGSGTIPLTNILTNEINNYNYRIIKLYIVEDLPQNAWGKHVVRKQPITLMIAQNNSTGLYKLLIPSTTKEILSSMRKVFPYNQLPQTSLLIATPAYYEPLKIVNKREFDYSPMAQAILAVALNRNLITLDDEFEII